MTAVVRLNDDKNLSGAIMAFLVRCDSIIFSVTGKRKTETVILDTNESGARTAIEIRLSGSV